MDCNACNEAGTKCTLYNCRNRLISRLCDFEDVAEEQSPVPIRRGTWILVGRVRDEDGYIIPVLRCSACSIPRDEEYPYCPSCGAKMEKCKNLNDDIVIVDTK